jgi:RimJ/RimL family protein N-acetyltransferase
VTKRTQLGRFHDETNPVARLHTLRDGTKVLTRPIAPSDKDELAKGLRRLSPTTIHRRFLSPKASFSRAELRYLTEVDGHDHVAFAVERLDYPGMIIAVGRWVRLPERPDTAEVAIVVADELQGLGLGSILADRLATAALEHDVRRFTATMLSENRAAHALMARLDGHLAARHNGAGAEEVVVDLVAA